MHIPPKRYIKSLDSHVYHFSDLNLSQSLNNVIHVDVFWLFVEFVTTMEIDMLPCNWRDLLKQFNLLAVPSFFFVRKQTGQDGGVIVDDTVGNQAAALVPELLFIFGSEA